MMEETREEADEWRRDLRRRIAAGWRPLPVRVELAEFFDRLGLGDGETS